MERLLNSGDKPVDTSRPALLVGSLAVEVTAGGRDIGPAVMVGLGGAALHDGNILWIDNALSYGSPSPPAPVVAPRPKMATLNNFSAVYLGYQRPIEAHIFRILGNQEEAKDLAADTFERAYRSLLERSEPIKHASQWLYRIATNIATDTLRRRQLVGWRSLEAPDRDGLTLRDALYDPDDGNSHLDHFSARQALHFIFDHLSPKDARALLLYEYEGFSCIDIADMLHISHKAAKTMVARARERARGIAERYMTGQPVKPKRGSRAGIRQPATNSAS